MEGMQDLRRQVPSQEPRSPSQVLRSTLPRGCRPGLPGTRGPAGARLEPRVRVSGGRAPKAASRARAARPPCKQRDLGIPNEEFDKAGN